MSKFNTLLEQTAGLSEDFKNQVAPLFEEAVNDAVAKERESMTESFKAEVAKLTEELENSRTENARLQEESESQLNAYQRAGERMEEDYKADLESIQEQIETLAETKTEEKVTELSEKLDSYFDYLAEEYVKSFKDSIVNEEKAKLAESFMGAIKTMFEQHNIDTPSGTGVYEERISELEEKVDDAYHALQESIDENHALKSQILDAEKIAICEEAIADFTVADKMRFKKIVGTVNTDNIEEFKEQVSTIVENFEPGSDFESSDFQRIVTDTIPEEKVESVKKQSLVEDPTVASIAAALLRMK